MADSVVKEDSDHGKLIEWVNSADDLTLESRELSEKCRDYYDSKQWTDDEVRKLKKQKQAATVINRIKPKLDGLMGMERANRTTAKAFARTPKHSAGATAATEGVRFVLDDNAYPQKRSAAWDNMLNEGTGGVEVIVKPGKPGQHRITINHIQWDRIIYDPHSRAKNFTDNPLFLGQVVWMDYEEAVNTYPDKKNVLEVMQDGSQTYDDKPRWMDGKRKRVKIVELYYRKGSDWWYACFTRGGFLKDPMKSPYINEEGETEHPYEFGSLFVDRDGVRYGASRQLLDIQDEVNKRRSKALHLMSVRQVRGERGAVEDVNKARQELAKPDGYIETTPGMEFEVLKTGDMAAAQFNLLTEAKGEIDSVSYNAAAQGKDTHLQSGVALRSREAAGQTEIAPMFDVLKHMDNRVYRKVWNRIKQYWKAEMWIRVTDNPQDLKWVGLNRPMTKGELALEQAKEKGATPEQLQQLQMQIAQDPTSQEKVVQNDIAELDVDIVMSDAPDTVTQEIEDFQAMAEMVKSGFPMPPKAVIMASPLSNKDQILKMMDESPQVPPELQKKMEAMQQEGQKLAQENQQLRQSNAESQMKLQAEARLEEMRLQMEERAKQRELLMESQAKERDAKTDAFLKRFEAVLDAKTKIEVAEISAGATVSAAQISAANKATEEA